MSCSPNSAFRWFYPNQDTPAYTGAVWNSFQHKSPLLFRIQFCFKRSISDQNVPTDLFTWIILFWLGFYSYCADVKMADESLCRLSCLAERPGNLRNMLSVTSSKVRWISIAFQRFSHPSNCSKSDPNDIVPHSQCCYDCGADSHHPLKWECL